MTTIKVLRVVARREGFRRAGFVFGAQPRDVAPDALTPAQRAAIVRDPMLLVTEIDVAKTEDLTESQPTDTDVAGTVVLPAAAASGRKRK